MRLLPGFGATAPETPDAIAERTSPKADGIGELATEPPTRIGVEPRGGATTGVCSRQGSLKADAPDALPTLPALPMHAFSRSINSSTAMAPTVPICTSVVSMVVFTTDDTFLSSSLIELTNSYTSDLEQAYLNNEPHVICELDEVALTTLRYSRRHPYNPNLTTMPKLSSNNTH